MAARRQPSTTSLSKYASTRPVSPGLQNRSLDFCNSFWGLADGGVDVLFARMRGASRTVEELRNYWKERAAIEDDYAKRMFKLSKVTLGKDEIGVLRISLDTIRLETERQASFHQNLAQQVRNELEAQMAALYAKQLHHKKAFQTNIEKEFKAKQTQETYVNKAREKYEADCVRINSYTAQSSLVQGKDLDKINLKLERAQQTVQANERDFANFAKALQDTVHKWEQDWKAFCDSCQDLEEERMEIMKDNMWAYANAVSTVCVADDESCEKIRLALEQMEPEKDMENFVRDYGTGNQIPDPPAFVNYNTPDAIPSSSSRPTSRPAQFARSTQREIPVRHASAPAEEVPVVNAAGVGAGGGNKRIDLQDVQNLTRQPTQIQAASSSQARTPQNNGYTGGQNSSGAGSPSVAGTSAQNLQRRSTTINQAPQQNFKPSHDPHAETIDPTAETYIKVGNNVYKADPSKDPQQPGASSSRAVTASPMKQNGGVDPLARQLEELQHVVSTTGSSRRNTMMKQPNGQEQKNGQPSRRSPGEAPSTLSPPGTSANLAAGGSTQGQNRSPSPIRDYRNSAEVVVGIHPSASRPASPNPPTAAFMVPKPAEAPGPVSSVQEVLLDYQQSLPGERKSISRSNSRRGSFAGQPSVPSQGQIAPGHHHSQSQGQNLIRPPSQIGHAGIGAHGSRSNSPQPISRGPSPAPNNVRNSYITPPPPQNMVRATSPNTVGIALDPSGRVLHDDMAQRFQQQQQQQQQRQPPPQQQQQPYNQMMAQQQQQQMQQQQQQRRSSFMAPANNTMVPPPVHNGYGVTPPPPNMYQPPPPQSSYMQPIVQPSYTPAPVQYQPPPQQQQQAVYQSPAGYGQMNGLQRGTSAAGQYYAPGAPSQQMVVQRQTPQQQQQLPQQQRLGYQQAYRDPSPVGRSPSPQPPQATMPPPTGQITEDGAGILFYVKALYDYSATIDEEFDFQAGDIIAVTATPEDGWWSGELLDETRRQKGRHVFPSNFVCLF